MEAAAYTPSVQEDVVRGFGSPARLLVFVTLKNI